MKPNIQTIEKNQDVNLGEISKLQQTNKKNVIQVKVKEISPEGKVVSTNWKDIVIKKWYKSKTMIFNLGVAVFTGIGSLLSDESFRVMVGDYFSYILTIVTIVNVYLRTVTNSAIKGGKL